MMILISSATDDRKIFVVLKQYKNPIDVNNHVRFAIGIKEM